MTRLLIAVHGMGSHPPKWSEAIREKLDEVAARYPSLAGSPLSQRYTFAEVRYDGIFERYVEKWQAQAAEFAKFQTEQGVKLPGLLAWLTDDTLPQDEKAAATSTFWSTLIDPILYRGFPVVRDEVRAAVMAQIVGHITSNMTSGAVDVSILAHSLGTAVLHDVLQLLASGASGGNASFTAKHWHFDRLFMVADVCKLGPPDLIDLRTDIDGYLVRPRDPNGAGGPESYYCARMFSFRHEWDPFVRWAPFNPPWGPDFLSPDPLTHVHQANTHGFTHYLDHPAVHIPIINSLVGFTAISAKEQLNAIANYPLIVSPQCSTEINELKALVQGLPAACDSLEDLAIKGVTFYLAARRAVAACKALGGDVVA